jgi:hypothetical protein
MTVQSVGELAAALEPYCQTNPQRPVLLGVDGALVAVTLAVEMAPRAGGVVAVLVLKPACMTVTG